MGDKVSLTTDGGVAVVTLNAPEARNALTNETIDELADALTECRSGAVRAVVLTGSGNAFCSGGRPPGVPTRGWSWERKSSRQGCTR